MKKLVLTSVAVMAGALMAHSQGYIALSDATADTVQTNGSSIAEGTGKLFNGASGYYFEVLDMTAASYTGLSSGQKTAADDLQVAGGSTAVSLWTDSAVSGVNTTGLTGGGVSGLGGASGTTAANWAAPTANTGYNTAANVDYYVIVGWSANEGTTWSQVSGELTSGTWTSVANGWFST